MKREKQSKSSFFLSVWMPKNAPNTLSYTHQSRNESYFFYSFLVSLWKKFNEKKRNLEKKGNCLLAYERFLHGTWGHAFSIANLEPQTHRYYLFFGVEIFYFNFPTFSLSVCVRESVSLYSLLESSLFVESYPRTAPPYPLALEVHTDINARQMPRGNSMYGQTTVEISSVQETAPHAHIRPYVHSV